MENFDDEVESLVKDTSGRGSSGAASQQSNRTISSPSSSPSSNNQQHIANKCRKFVSIPALLVLACILVVGKLTIKTSYESAETSDLVPSPAGEADSADKARPVSPDPPKEVPTNQPPAQPQQGATNAEAEGGGVQDEPATVDSPETATGTTGEAEGTASIETGGGTPAAPAPAPATTSSEVGGIPVETGTTGEAEGTASIETGGGTPAAPAPAPATTSSEVGGIPVERPGFKRPPRQWSEAYVPRGFPERADLTKLAEKWGSWTLVDEKANTRPKDDVFAAYPNRDIPWDKIPSEAWQRDPEYLPKFLKEGIDLTDRAMEAILSEYGSGKDDKPEVDFEERSKLFSINLKDLDPPPAEKPDTRHLDESPVSNGSWLAKRSYESLVRRVLHAIVTEDTFTFVMGGHSSAAGHGNPFKQSYTPQLQRLLEPVFARLGVLFESHNIGMGGLGTIHNAVAAGSIYGKEMDMLMWDSSMTEKDAKKYDLFARQGLIGGNRAPILIGGKAQDRAYKYYDAEIGSVGGAKGLPKTMDAEQALEVPYAARFMNCDREARTLCGKNKYNGTCWNPRPDFEPPSKQSANPGGRASWHPGNRSHQIKSRSLAFPILMALRDALKLWQEADGHVLSDGDFHMTPEYNNTQSKVIAAEETNSYCYSLVGKAIPKNFCKYPVQGRSEFLPRSNPVASSIRSIMKHGDYFPQESGNWYDPPDVYDPFLEPPAGEVNYLHIVENGVDYAPSRARRKIVALRKSQIGGIKGLSADDAIIKPNHGWHLSTKAAGYLCDGSYDSFCSRVGGCLLYGHNDNRGGISFDSLSGWIVLQLDQVRYGSIVVKIEPWHKGRPENPVTKDWKCVNNDCGANNRTLAERSGKIPEVVSMAGKEDISGWNGLSRRLPAECPGNFRFEFAIDGNITSQTWEEFYTQGKHTGARNVDFYWLVNDPQFAKDGPRDVEVALRMTGCNLDAGKNYNVFKLTHVYWN